MNVPKVVCLSVNPPAMLPTSWVSAGSRRSGDIDLDHPPENRQSDANHFSQLTRPWACRVQDSAGADLAARCRDTEPTVRPRSDRGDLGVRAHACAAPDGQSRK